MGVRRKTASRIQFAAKIVELFFLKAPFKEGAGVHSRCSVTLEINYVTIAAFGLCVKKMIECNFVERRG